MQRKSQTPIILKTNKLMNEDMLASLVANYESKYCLNPLEKNRRKEIVTARHCLTFILMNRFGFGPSQTGRLLNKNHATTLNSKKIVRNMLLTRNAEYIDEIVKWSEVFDELLPDGNLSNLIIQQRVELLLHSLTDDRLAVIEALEGLIEKFKGQATDLIDSGVI